MDKKTKKYGKPSIAKRLWQKSSGLRSADALYFCSLLILLFFTSIITVASVMHLAHIVIGIWTAPLAMVLTVTIYFWLNKATDTKQSLNGLYTFLIVIVTLTLFCGLFYEMSWDGNAYHKTTVGALANGWNPVYESMDDYLKRADLLNFPTSPAIWGDHYAKAAWLFAAGIYKVTGNIECGKVYAPLMMIALFGVAHHYLRSRKEFTRKQAITLAVLTALNPVTLPQLLTYMNDGLLCSTLFLLILCLTTLTDNSYKVDRRLQWATAICCILICCNIKFTGLAYTGVFCVLYYLLHIIREKKGLRFRKSVKLVTLYALVFCFAVFVIGSSTYVKNTIEHGHPFYPLRGEGAVDIIYNNQPDSFNDMSTAEKLFRSTFSQTANLARHRNQEPQLKVPFTIYLKEFTSSAATDTRIAGFGPWFSGILLASLVPLVLALVRLCKEKRFAFYLLAGNLLLIFVLMFTLGESWWARYFPFLYLLPLVACAISCVRAGRSTEKKKRWFSRLFSVALILNTAFFLPAFFHNFGTVLVHMQSAAIKREEAPVVLYFDTYHKYTGVYYNLVDMGVSVDITTQPPENAKYYYLLTTKYESTQEESGLVIWIEELAKRFS